MIADHETNSLYLADCLPSKFPAFFENFDTVLKRNQIDYKFLPQTKDVWAVDYMPIQIDTSRFVQFDYNPDYLKDEEWQKTISNVDEICQLIDIQPLKSNIKIDGGNVVRTKDKIIMCDKVFKENPEIKEQNLIEQLRNIFEIEKLVFIPTHPEDFTGHADGLVRFLDDETVLINDFSKATGKEKEFALTFRKALQDAGLTYLEIPYNPYQNKNYEDAKGIYINYLQMKELIIVPSFGLPEDEKILQQFTGLFPGYRIDTFDCSEIAAESGILNCITWNIKTN